MNTWNPNYLQIGSEFSTCIMNYYKTNPYNLLNLLRHDITFSHNQTNIQGAHEMIQYLASNIQLTQIDVNYGQTQIHPLDGGYIMVNLYGFLLKNNNNVLPYLTNNLNTTNSRENPIDITMIMSPDSLGNYYVSNMTIKTKEPEEVHSYTYYGVNHSMF